MVVYVAAEVVRTMKPRTSANEDAIHEPFRAVIAVRRTSIGWSFIVSIGTNRRRSNLDADLSICGRGGHRQANCRNSSYGEVIECLHKNFLENFDVIIRLAVVRRDSKDRRAAIRA